MAGRWEKKAEKKQEKKTNLKFQGRKRSKKGVVSMVFSFIAFAGLLTASILSGLAKGNAGIIVGYIGAGCLLVALVGFVLGVKSLMERDILYFQPIFGTAVNALLLIALVAIYLTGIFL